MVGAFLLALGLFLAPAAQATEEDWTEIVHGDPSRYCSGSSRATTSIGSCSEIETRWKAITCSLTETSPKWSSTPEVVRCSRRS